MDVASPVGLKFVVSKEGFYNDLSGAEAGTLVAGTLSAKFDGRTVSTHCVLKR